MQRHTEAYRGTQRHTEAYRGMQRHAEAHRGIQRHTQAYRGTQRHTDIQRHAEAYRGTQRQLYLCVAFSAERSFFQQRFQIPNTLRVDVLPSLDIIQSIHNTIERAPELAIKYLLRIGS